MEPDDRRTRNDRAPSLKREVKGLAILWVAFAVVCAVVAVTCSGPAHR